MEPKAEGKKQKLIMILSFKIIIFIYIFKPMSRDSLALPSPGPPPLDIFPEIITRII